MIERSDPIRPMAAGSFVIPAKAGIHMRSADAPASASGNWIPALAGMTKAFCKGLAFVGMTSGLVALSPALAAPPPAAAAYNQRLMKLDPARRAAVVRSAIVDFGQRCGRIEPPVYRGPYKNMFMWAARCQPGGEYAVYIGPDGSAQVRPCADQAKLGLPACALPPATATKPRRRS